MKKRLFSIVTALIMICSFVGVMPHFEVEAKSITVFQQTDSRWSSHGYGYSDTAGTVRATIGSGGCGILAYVNAVYYMNGSFINPITLADWSLSHGHRVNGEGTAYSLYKSFADSCGSQYNLKFTGTTSSFSTLKSHLQKGGTAIYGAPDHIMCVVDYNASNGKYLLLDSYKSSSRKTDTTGGYRWLTKSEFTGKVAVNIAFHMIENRTTIPDPDPHELSAYLPLTAYLWQNETAYVSTGEIWAEDKCTITAIYDDGTCDVTYPVGSTTKSVTTSLSYFIPNTSDNYETFTASGQINAYSRPDMSVNIGYTDPGDTCVKVASSGNATQIIYPVSGGFKLGWIDTSAITPVVTTTAQTTPKVTTTKAVVPNQFSAYLPLTAYLWENKTAYVSTGEIWAEDKCTITAIYSDGTCDVTYPVGSTTKSVNTSLSYFIPNAFSQFEKVTVTEKIYVYSRPDMSVNIGYTDPGDSCVIVSTSGNKSQIIYPISEGFKLGWVNTIPVVTTTVQTTPKVTTKTTITTTTPKATTKATTTTPKATTKATTTTTKATTKATTTTTTPKVTTKATTTTSKVTTKVTTTTSKVTTKVTTTTTVHVTTVSVTESFVFGDVNSDNELNLRDVVILRRYIAGGWDDVINETAADMNGDSEVNLKDVVLQRRKIVGGWESAITPTETYSSFVYGESENGRELICHSITPQQYDKTILMNFAIHGFEDAYNKDGQVLVDTAEKLIEYYKEFENLSTRILIIPSANPDGLLDGTTNNGFGRCNAKGIDLNRDFDANYTANTTQGRNYTPYAFSASESRALRDLCLEYKPEIVLDFHGWLDYTIGDIELAEVFYQEMSLSHHVSFTDSNASGYFANWAHQQGSLGLLVEFTNDNIPYENLVSALDRLVKGNYDNGQGEYEEDERFSQFDSIGTYTLLSENVTTYMGFDVPFDTVSYIDGTKDLCTIEKVYKNGWVKVNYPVSSGMKTAYAKLSDFISEENITEFKNAYVSENTTVYRKSDMTETIGSVWTTDEFIIIAETDNIAQIVYPLDAGGWKMGWIEKSSLI